MSAMSSEQKREDYRRKVDRELRALYGIDWRDACGEDGPLESALASGEAAGSFARRWGEKYDLERLVPPRTAHRQG